ncbi:hypothetical protein ABSL23_02245 [Halobacterium sp. NMX12-1]|uniref:Uncharacterized protein n=1 Tax=Halobacterium sp. NMX12-1 TaxID=3166650 RepID=A0AAU8CF76_9EURY
MPWPQVVMAVCAIITALCALGTVGYVRRAARDAHWSRRALEGEEHSDGLIQRVAENTQRSKRNKRVLRREGLRADGGPEYTFGDSDE